MTRTEKLRALLRERGVEYMTDDGEHVRETCWPFGGELMATFVEYDNGTTRFEMDHWCFTPEQAVEATLGRMECHVVAEHVDIDGESMTDYSCGCCNQSGRSHNYCPNCGAKVVSE